MKNFLIDSYTGDIVLTPQRQIAMVYDDDAIIQKVERTLTTNLEEWFLDPSFGFPRFEVLGKTSNVAYATQLLHDAILQVEEIERVDTLNFEVDRANRRLVVNPVLIKTDGERLEVGEIVNRIRV